MKKFFLTALTILLTLTLLTPNPSLVAERYRL